MKPIGGKMRQRVTTLMFVDDRDIHRPQNRAQKPGGTMTACRPTADTGRGVGVVHGALNRPQHWRLTAILPYLLKNFRVMLAKEMVQVVMTPCERSHDRLIAVWTN